MVVKMDLFTELGLKKDEPAVASNLFQDLGLEAPKPVVTTVGRDQILKSKEDIDAIRKMMVKSQGTDYLSVPDEQLYDEFLTHMRWTNTNEVSTVKEAMDVLGADEKTKAIYGRAYDVYDKTNNMFKEDWGDVGRGAWDYTKAIITSPSTYLGGILGKTVGRAGTKKLQQEALQAAMTAVAKKTGNNEVAKVAVKQELVRMTARVNTRKALAAATVAEGVTAGFQDALYQEIMMEAGSQEDFSFVQNLASVALGSVGGLSTLAMTKKKKGTSGLGGVDEAVKVSKEVRRKNVNKVVEEEAAKLVAKASADWAALVKEGVNIDANRELRSSVIKWFTDYNTDTGFVSILQKAGADLDVETSGGFARSLVDFATDLEPAAKNALSKAFEPLGVNFDQVVAVFSAAANEAGKNNNYLSLASKFWDNFKNVTVANKSAGEGVINGLPQTKPELDPKTLQYMQSVWKRAIVSHPGTTLLNVKGWMVASTARSAAEALQMATLYGKAGVEALIGKDSKVSLSQAKALKDNLQYMSRIAVDPFTTVDGFYKLLEMAPKKIQGKVQQQFFQGVDSRGPAAFNINPDGKAVKATEWYLEKAQRLSLVTFQDLLTKSLSGVKELDKQVRLEKGMGLTELLEAGKVHEISETAWEKTTKVLQEDTFSTDFRHATGPLGKIASYIQEFSSLPVIGLAFPFGQFANSVIAFTWRYSPMGLVHPLTKALTGKGDLDVGLKVMQGVVGTTALALLTQREEEKRKDGLQWFEERDDKGDVYKVDNLFPVSVYNLTGRIINDWLKGEGSSKDLYVELGRQFALPAALEEIAGPKFVLDMVRYMTEPNIGDAERGAFMNVVGMALESIAGTASGITRPLDMVNDTIALSGELTGVYDNAVPDRKLVRDPLERIILELTRYTDAIFAPLLGEEGPEGYRMAAPKQSATQDGPVRPGNAMSAIYGVNYQQRRTYIDRLLGVVNKAPFRADSFTTGVPEYDNWLNEVITPHLEEKARSLLKNPNFEKLTMSAKIDKVESMIKETRKEVRALLDTPYGRTTQDYLRSEQAKLLARPSGARKGAKAALNIIKPDHELTLLEIQMLNTEMGLEKKYLETQVK